MKVLNLNKKKWRQHRDEIENWILLAKLMETHRTTIDERFSTNFNQHMNKKKKKLKHRTAESKMRWNKYKSSNIHFTIWIVWSEKKENNNYTEGRENHFAFPYRNWRFLVASILFMQTPNFNCVFIFVWSFNLSLPVSAYYLHYAYARSTGLVVMFVKLFR